MESLEEQLAEIRKDVKEIKETLNGWMNPFDGPFAETGKLRVKVNGLLWFGGVVATAIVGLA